MNPFVVADRLTGAKGGQFPVRLTDMAPTRYSAMSQCIPRQEDIWLDLEHPGPEKPRHDLVTGEARGPHVPQQASRGAALPASPRRRSNLDRGGALPAEGNDAQAQKYAAESRRQEEDLALGRRYKDASALLPGPRQSRDNLTTDLQQKRAYGQDVWREEEPSKSPERAMPFRRPSRKQLPPAAEAHERPEHEQMVEQADRKRSMASTTNEYWSVAGDRPLSPVLAPRQEQPTALLSGLQDRLIQVDSRGGSYRARPGVDPEAGYNHGPDYTYGTARLAHRSELQSASRRNERPDLPQTPQVDYRAGLRHPVSATPRPLKHMASSPALLRKAPPLVRDHSRHRSPNPPVDNDDCGYCEPEDAARVRSTASPSGSYYTAASSATATPRPLHHMGRSIVNLRGSALASSQATATSPDSSRTVTPSAATLPAATLSEKRGPSRGNRPTGTSSSPQPPAGVQQSKNRHSDRDSDQKDARHQGGHLAGQIARLKARIAGRREAVESKVGDDAAGDAADVREKSEREEGIQTDGTLVLIRGITVTLHMRDDDPGEDVVMRADLTGEGMGA